MTTGKKGQRIGVCSVEGSCPHLGYEGEVLHLGVGVGGAQQRQVVEQV